MTLQKAQDSLDCSHCESIGEISFERLQRQQKNLPLKVLVRNIPEGLSESGLKNLFLTVGEPISINYTPKSKSAIVEFTLMNEVELAIRDLHCKPPYNLKVTLAIPRPKHDVELKNGFSGHKREEIFINVTPQKTREITGYPQRKDEDFDRLVSKVENKVKSIIKNHGYDPSIRMRQKKLDFQTESKCVSRGRGYLNMGDKDRFIGGLDKFECSSANSTAKDKMSFSCENCQALTTKICGNCSASYCSVACLTSSSADHRGNCCKSKIRHSSEGFSPGADFTDREDDKYPEVPLKSGCTVVMTSYFTMPTVFVRPCDGVWEEKFQRLCNDVAIEALKGAKFEITPSLHMLVIAKYYEDLCFYRAQVCSSVKENKITVFFVDFGNTQETRLEDLVALPVHLKSLPGLAVRVQLKNVPGISSMDAVNYYNKLTAESTPLVLKFDTSMDEVFLIEKDSKASVNETAVNLALPSWKKDDSAFSKTGDVGSVISGSDPSSNCFKWFLHCSNSSGEVFYLNSMKQQKLEAGKTYDLIVSHFDEKEFLESDVFWVNVKDTEEFMHASTEMLLRITEYCRFLKGDCYLPRTNELCLANENGKWHRCVNLKSHKTTCCLFFVDDGHSSFITTDNIRKMIQDFTEIPSQSVCCTLPDEPKLKNNKEYQSEVIDYLKSAVGQTVISVRVLKLMGDAYGLAIPGVRDIASYFLNKNSDLK